MDATSLFQDIRLVPVIALQDQALAVDLALCLRDAGIGAIEVTLRTEAGLPAIELVANQVPDVMVGAGSVRFEHQFPEIFERGARFAVSPGASDKLLKMAARMRLPFVPGAATASEILALMEWDYSLIKFFPAENLGGVKMLKALSAPLPEARFFPTGGINADLIRDYLELSCVSCVGGSWFVPADLLAAKRFQDIQKLTEQALKLIND
jgi:2-dehydro-3-deoxyphosphogluconate aldolase/(4S)-4-hydroxy-2-oxoglutarate aldolase